MSQLRVQLLVEQMDYTFGQGGWYRALDQAVAGLTPEQAAWQPGKGTNTIWQTVNHLTFWKELCTRRLNGAPMTSERINNDATFGEPGNPYDEWAWQDTLQRMRGAQYAFRAAVAELDDSQLDLPLSGEKTPLKELLSGLSVHDGYHLGQIALIRKLQGSWQL